MAVLKLVSIEDNKVIVSMPLVNICETLHNFLIQASGHILKSFAYIAKDFTCPHGLQELAKEIGGRRSMIRFAF